MSYTLEDLVDINEVSILKKIAQSKVFSRVLLCVNLANPSISALDLSNKLKLDVSLIRNNLYMMESMDLVKKHKSTRKRVVFMPTPEIKHYVNQALESIGKGVVSGSKNNSE